MRTPKVKMHRVLVIVRMTSSGRELLQGALNYARSDAYCTVVIDQMPDALTPERVRQFAADGYSGILTSEIGMTPDVTAAFAELSVPMVVMGSPDPRLAPRRVNLAFVGVDEEEIGRRGAEHLASLGACNSMGFVSTYEGLPWSDLRRRGFMKAAAKFSKDVRAYSDPARLPSATTRDDRAQLESWLLDLPKPAAVMVDHDVRAAQVIEICKSRNLKIPSQVTVLGVDNDRAICDFTSPPLSSVLADHEQVGFRAAAQLNVLMRRRRPGTKVAVVRCPVKTVVARASTRPISPAGQLVHRALAFIDEHVCEGIRVTDVVRHLGVSRALADLRFRQIEGRSILDAIQSRRLAEAQRLLLSTHDSLTRIAAAAGFSNPKHLQRLFKARFGMTLSDYRAAAF